MFTVNEIETIDRDKEKFNFNTSFDIELVFPSQNIYKYKYNLMELFDFKYCIENNFIKNHSRFLKITNRKICKLPNILIITIVQALIGKYFNLHQIIIPEEIDLDKYIDKDILKDTTQYELFAVNKKLGISYSNGHYLCDIKFGKQWIEFNDEKVYKIDFDFSKPYCSVVGLFYCKSK